MVKSPFGKVRDELASALAAALAAMDYNPKSLENTIDFSKGPGFGDISCSVAFRLSKEKPGAPNDIAKGIAAKLPKIDSIKRVDVQGGYINFTIDRARFTKDTVDYAFVVDKDTPVSEMGKGIRAITEYPSANPAHPLHVGQVRSALLGDCVSNIHAACGYDVEREDYINDLGLQAAVALWGMMNLERIHGNENQQKKFDQVLGEVYVAANTYLTEHKEAEEEVKALMQLAEREGTYESRMSRMQAGEYIRAERQTTFNYNIYHDLLIWESDVIREKLLERALEMLKQSGITETPNDGKYKDCLIISLSKIKELPKEFKGLREDAKVLIRSNGTPNYLAKDIAFHMWKFGILGNTFKYKTFIEKQPNGKPLYTTAPEGLPMDFGGGKKIINMIDARQSAEQLMMKVIFDAMGKPEAAAGFNHLAYGVVELESGILAGRKGTWLGFTADDLLREATEKAESLISDRVKMDDQEKKTAARSVALGAIKFEFMKFAPEKGIVFSWAKALNFEGNSGPYCQYMYARAIRLLEDSKLTGNISYDPNEITTDYEFDLVKALSKVNEMAEKACNELRPNVIAEYCIDLAVLFSNFYEQLPILKAPDEKQKQARLALTLAFANIMRYSLALLGIPVVNRM
jgi:arginyl-tRNA synthetase